jgi:hypothetical protein
MEEEDHNETMKNESQQDETMQGERPTGSQKGFKDASPDDVKHKVKESVQKGVAAVAGALKGFSEEAKKHNLADATKEAISKAGETTRQVVGTTAQELKRTKEHVKEAARKPATPSSVGAQGGSSIPGGSEERNLRPTWARRTRS